MSAKDRQIGGAHYQNMKIQPFEFCEGNGLSALESAAIKYIVRHRTKNGSVDLDKAIHCLELLKEHTYGVGE